MLGLITSIMTAALDWLDRVDPGMHRRIKGLRLVTAYGIAAMLGSLGDITQGLTDSGSPGSLAAGFALWASVSEGRTKRAESSRHLLLLCAAAAFGAVSFIVLAPILRGTGPAGPELVLVIGAFLVGYLRRFGLLGTGIGSQIYIGQLMAYEAKLAWADFQVVAVAGALAMLASIVPRVLSGPTEHPAAVASAPSAATEGVRPELAMGLQAGMAALAIVMLDAVIGLEQPAWAITACTYVIANSAAGTIDRVRRRIIGTAVGVPLGLACLPLAIHAPLLIWLAATFAMIVYAMALPERYDIACGAFAFALIVTLAAGGEHSLTLLAARAWETLLGGALGLATAVLVFPLRRSSAPDP